MREISRTQLPLRALLVGLAAIAPTAFPAAQAGYSNLHELAYLAIIPAAVLLVLAWAILRKSSVELAALIRDGAVAGALATVALEAVRYSGFRLGFMPGNLPELMGVLLFDRFALGPTAASTLGGLLIIFGTAPVSESSSRLGASNCQFGGPFPTEPLWALVSSSVPWSRVWALAFSD